VDILKNCIVLVSNSADGDLSTYELDTSTPTLRASERHAIGSQVMPLALCADQRTIYAATRGAAPSLVKCALDTRTGHLTDEYRIAIDASLVSIATDRSGRFLFGASYGGHEMIVYSVARLDSGDSTPLQTLSGVRNAHAVVVSDDNRFVYVTSLGNDELLCCEIDENQTQLLTVVDTVSFEDGFGPRHMRLSPGGEWLYVLSEFRATVAVFRRDAANGKLGLHGVSPRASVLAGMNDGFARPPATDPQPDPTTLSSLIWAADIHVRPDGRFVYISERTTNRLLVLRVRSDGMLEHAGHAETEAQPRGFCIDPSGRFLVVCGERSTRVSLFSIDAESGALTLCSSSGGGQGANWVEIVSRTRTPRI
jgi:6-phosphogluconolactonase